MWYVLIWHGYLDITPCIAPRLLCLIMTRSRQYMVHNRVTHTVHMFVAPHHLCSPSTSRLYSYPVATNACICMYVYGGSIN